MYTHIYIHLSSIYVSMYLCIYLSIYLIYLSHIFFNSSSVDGHLGCFHILTIVNSVAMIIQVHVSSRIRVFSGYVPRSGIAGSYANSMLVFKEPPYCSP